MPLPIVAPIFFTPLTTEVVKLLKPGRALLMPAPMEVTTVFAPFHKAPATVLSALAIGAKIGESVAVKKLLIALVMGVKKVTAISPISRSAAPHLPALIFSIMRIGVMTIPLTTFPNASAAFTATRPIDWKTSPMAFATFLKTFPIQEKSPAPRKARSSL